MEQITSKVLGAGLMAIGAAIPVYEKLRSTAEAAGETPPGRLLGEALKLVEPVAKPVLGLIPGFGGHGEESGPAEGSNGARSASETASPAAKTSAATQTGPETRRSADRKPAGESAKKTSPKSAKTSAKSPKSKKPSGKTSANSSATGSASGSATKSGTTRKPSGGTASKSGAGTKKPSGGATPKSGAGTKGKESSGGTASKSRPGTTGKKSAQQKGDSKPAAGSTNGSDGGAAPESESAPIVSLPLPTYTHLKMPAILDALNGLTKPQLRQIQEYESGHENRGPILDRINELLAVPLPGE